jgi:putative molybdopterin biosynthesis protein
MENMETLRALDRIKVLADARRLAVLRLLMASPATLSQLARSLRHSPAWIQHHLRLLESASLVELVEVRKSGRVTEKYYQATRGAFYIQAVILPKSTRPTVVFSGSHDLAVQAMARRLAKRMRIVSLYVGSLDGLLNLRQGLCQLAGAHLRDESGEYNSSYVRRFFPDRRVELVTLAHRTQGFMVSAGNPKSIRAIDDLARPGVRFVNRNSGSGTRLWLEQELGRAGLERPSIRGYRREVATHTEAAVLIAAGRADVALGLQAAAYGHGLDFVPLFEERYDVAFGPQDEKSLDPVLNYIQTADFRTSLASLTGYGTAHSGEHIQLEKEHTR